MNTRHNYDSDGSYYDQLDNGDDPSCELNFDEDGRTGRPLKLALTHGEVSGDFVGDLERSVDSSLLDDEADEVMLGLLIAAEDDAQ